MVTQHRVNSKVRVIDAPRMTTDNIRVTSWGNVMRRLFALFAVAVAVSPALACINDSELPGHEREFRSSYQTDRKPAESGPSLIQQYGPGTAASVGGVLLLAAGIITVRRLTAKG